LIKVKKDKSQSKVGGAMKTKKTKQTESLPTMPQWSERSKASLKKQYQLEQKIKKFESSIAAERQSLKKLEADRARQTNLVDGGKNVYRRNLADTLASIEDAKKLIACYEREIENVKAQVADLQPTPETALHRQAVQTVIAQLAGEVVQRTQELDGSIARVKRQLQSIIAVQQSMQALAKDIDLQVKDSFGEHDFQTLLYSMPSEMSPARERWLHWLLGIEPRSELRIGKETAEFHETLASAHFYRHGEIALLNEQDYKTATYEAPRLPSPLEVEEEQRQHELQLRTGINVGNPRFVLPGQA
jgi:hypothetical protein